MTTCFILIIARKSNGVKHFDACLQGFRENRLSAQLLPVHAEFHLIFHLLAPQWTDRFMIKQGDGLLPLSKVVRGIN